MIYYDDKSHDISAITAVAASVMTIVSHFKAETTKQNTSDLQKIVSIYGVIKLALKR